MNALQIDQKVSVSGLAGSVSVLAVWCLGTFAHVQVPPEIASCITTITMFIAGYLTPRSQ